jgi:hypothetical protein
MLIGTGGSQVTGMKFGAEDDSAGDGTIESKRRRVDIDIVAAWDTTTDVPVTVPSLLATPGPHLFLDEASIANLEVIRLYVPAFSSLGIVGVLFDHSCLPMETAALKGRCCIG